MLSNESNTDDLFFEQVRDALRSRTRSSSVRPHSDSRLLEIHNFEIIGELHRGGQGIVYEAIQRNPNRRVALKVLLHGSFSSERQRYRFEREVQLIAGLNHPNIVTVYDSGFVNGQPYYAMEFIQGVPLNQDDRFSRPTNPGSRQSRNHVRRTLKLMEVIGTAVTCFQRHGLIHRDLKPDNILVDKAGQPHILDFGLARRIDDSGDENPELQTRSGEFLGTLAYASPEQLSGSSTTVDARSDVYALGVVLYELLVGELPQKINGSMAAVIHRICHEDPQPPSVGNPAIDRDVDTIISKAISREPARRYQSAEKLVEDIRRCLAGQAIEARRDSTLYVLRKTIRRHWAAFLGVAAFIILLSASSIAGFMLWRQAETRLDRAITAEAVADEARKEAEFRASVASLAASFGAMHDYHALDAYDHLHRVALGLRDFEWQYGLSRIDTSIATWKYDLDGMSLISASDDGTRIALAGRNGAIRIMDPSSGEVLLAHDGDVGITALKMHPVSDVVIVGYEDGRFRELNLATNSWQRDFRSLSASVNDIQINAAGTRLVACAGYYPSTVFEFTIRDYESDATIVFDTKPVYAIDMNSDGTRVAAGGDGVTIYDCETGRATGFAAMDSHWCYHLAFTEDGTEVVASSTDQITIFDARSLKERTRFPCQRAVTRGLTIDPQQRTIVTSAADGTIRLWDIENGKPTGVLWGHGAGVGGVVFSHDGTRLLSIDQKGNVKVWNPQVDVGDYKISAHSSAVYGVQYDSNGSQVATCSFSGSIKLWDVATGRHLKTLDAEGSSVNGIAFSPDDSLLASGSADGTVRIWNLMTGRSHQMMGHTDEVLCVAFHSDGKSITSGAKDGTVRLWSVETQKELAVFEPKHKEPIRWIRFLPDGNTVIAEQSDAIIVLNINQNQIEQRWAKPRNTWYAAAAMHPTGAYVATGDDVGAIGLWDVSRGELVSRFEWHETTLSALAFNPDGSRLVAVSVDGAVKVWHVERQVEVFSLPSSGKIIQCLDFSPDGRRVAAGQYDGAMVWWEAIPPEERLAPRF